MIRYLTASGSLFIYIYIHHCLLGTLRKMLLAHNWKNHHHIFKSLYEAHACARAEMKDIEAADDLIRPDNMTSSCESSKKHGFKNIFEKSVDEYECRLLISDESAASGSKSDTDIDT